MHVLFVGPFPWPSHQGSQVYLAGQAQALVARGHRVTLAVYGGGTGGELPGVTLLRARRVPLARFTTGGMHWSRPLADLALARRIHSFCRQEQVDVLHAHNVEGPLVARLARTRLPIVYDLHTEMEEELPSHLRWPLRPLGRPLGRALDRAALRAADAGCAISHRAEAVLRGADLPTVTVGPGVDPSQLRARPGARERFGLPERFVLYTGNLDRYQDVPLLLNAMAQLPWPLVVVTGSHDPLPPWVQVIRTRAFQDVVDVLAHATVAVIPRRQCTGFPIKLLNQLGMGVPTVMLDTAAQPLPGVLCCPVDALPETLRAVLEDPEHAARLGGLGREEVLRRWTWSDRAERLESLYGVLGT